MSLETATYISDLNPAWPTGAEAKSAGDDHLRAVKATLKATFPAIAGAVTATHTELSLLHGKTDVATAADIAAAALSATLPGQAGRAGKFLTTDGTSASFAGIDGRGSPVIDLGNSGAGTVVCTFSESAEGWLLAATGSFTLTASGFPAGRLAGGLLKITNPGAYSITSTGILWVMSNGAKTSTFANAGYPLQQSGENHFALWSYGDGIVYGRAV